MQMLLRLTSAGILVALLLMLVCAEAHASQRDRARVDTLPNGTVRVSNPPQGLWTQADAWRLVPDFQLGSADGPEAVIFSAISGLAVDYQGRIYVLDREANELRIFSASGQHLRTIGRAGGGPGEYRNANGLVWVARDTLVIVDQRGERYTLLTRDGAYVRAVPRQLGFFGWVFQGATVEGRIYEHASIRSGTDYRPALVRTPLLGDGGPRTARDTVLLPLPAVARIEPFSIQTARGGMMMGVPFAPSAVYHLDKRGRIWHGFGSEFRVFRSSVAGDTALEIRLDAQPAPVTKAEVEEWEQGESVKRFRGMGGQLDMSRIPKVKPFYDGLYVSPDGDLWVSVPAAAGEATFAVFNAEGRFLGRLSAKGVTRYPYLPAAVVHNDRLYLVGQDELDVPKVFVFRIEKGRPRRN
jgi:hypothetical protein